MTEQELLDRCAKAGHDTIFQKYMAGSYMAATGVFLQRQQWHKDPGLRADWRAAAKAILAMALDHNFKGILLCAECCTECAITTCCFCEKCYEMLTEAKKLRFQR